MQNKIKMRSEKVAVEKIGSNRKTQSFIHIPDEDNTVGIVRFVPDDVKDLKEGQKVYFGNQYAKTTIEGKEYFIMSESNIFASVEG